MWRGRGRECTIVELGEHRGAKKSSYQGIHLKVRRLNHSLGLDPFVEQSHANLIPAQLFQVLNCHIRVSIVRFL